MKKLFASVGILSLAFAVAAGEPSPAPAPSASELIQQLGSQDYRTREEAAAGLEKAGTAAIPALREAAKSDNPEVRLRVAPILVKLERAATSNEKLAAKKVTLNYKDTPLGTALTDLRARTGLNIAFDPQRIKDPFRKVTCQTAELPVWEALEAFCAAAGLREEFQHEIDVSKKQSHTSGYIAYPITPTVGINAVPVTLVEGKPVRLPGDRRTAVRVLVLPPSFPGHKVTLGTGETTLCFDITPAPGLNWQEVSAMKITKLIDDAGRIGGAGTLKNQVFESAEFDGLMAWGGPGVRINGRFDARGYPMSPTVAANPRVHPVPLKFGTTAARSIKRLEGSVFGELTLHNQALITVTDPAKNTGLTYDGPGEVQLTVTSATQTDAGWAVQMSLAFPSPWAISSRRGANPGGFWPEAPRQGQAVTVQAFNAAGKPMEPGVANLPGQMSPDGMRMTQQLNWTFPKQVGLPARIVVNGPRPVVVEVPFVLENVPLP